MSESAPPGRPGTPARSRAPLVVIALLLAAGAAMLLAEHGRVRRGGEPPVRPHLASERPSGAPPPVAEAALGGEPLPASGRR